MLYHVVCEGAWCRVLAWAWGLLRCSVVSMMDRLRQLIKACELWNLCSRSFTLEPRERAVASCTCVFHKACFPAAVLISGALLPQFWGQETGDSSKPHLSACSSFVHWIHVSTGQTQVPASFAQSHSHHSLVKTCANQLPLLPRELWYSSWSKLGYGIHRADQLLKVELTSLIIWTMIHIRGRICFAVHWAVSAQLQFFTWAEMHHAHKKLLSLWDRIMKEAAAFMHMKQVSKCISVAQSDIFSPTAVEDG